jgi:hypothetical protein
MGTGLAPPLGRLMAQKAEMQLKRGHEGNRFPITQNLQGLLRDAVGALLNATGDSSLNLHISVQQAISLDLLFLS